MANIDIGGNNKGKYSEKETPFLSQSDTGLEVERTFPIEEEKKEFNMMAVFAKYANYDPDQEEYENSNAKLNDSFEESLLSMGDKEEESPLSIGDKAKNRASSSTKARNTIKAFLFQKEKQVQTSKSPLLSQKFLLAGLVEIITLLQGKSLEEIRQSINSNPEMKEKLPTEFISKIRRQDFEFLLNNQVIFKYLIIDDIGNNAFNLINELISTLRITNYLEIKLYLVRLILDTLTYEQNKQVLASIQKLFSMKDERSVAYTCENPLKLIILALETTKKIEHRRPQLGYLCKKTQENLIILGKKVQESIETIEHQIVVYLDKDIKGRIVISIMNKLNEEELFKDDKLLTVAEILWKSKYEINPDLSQMSTLLKVHMEKKNLFNYLGKSNIIKPESYIFSYKIWRESGMARYFLKGIQEFLYLIAISIIFIHTAHLLEDSNNSTNEELDNWLIVTEVFVCIQFCIIFQLVLNLRVQYKLGIGYHFGLSSILELLAVAVASYATYVFESIMPLYLVNYREIMHVRFCLYIGLLIFLNFIRIAEKVKHSRAIGYIILALEKLLIDLIGYIALFGLELLCFALLMSIAFSKADQYKSFPTSFETLFDNVLSLPSAKEMGDLAQYGYGPVEDWIAYLITIIFFVINMIIAMNIAIAILSDSYANVQDTADYIYIRKTLQAYDIYQHNNYSGIITAFFPLNIALYPLTFFLAFLCPESKLEKLNDFILYLEYLPIFCLIAIILLICELLFLPFTYLYHIYCIFSEFALKSIERKSGKRIIGEIVMWIISGVFILVYYIGKDLVTLVQSIYQKQFNWIIKYEEETEINYNTLQKALAIFKPIQNMKLTKEEFEDKLKGLQERGKLFEIFEKGFIEEEEEIRKKVINVAIICNVLELYNVFYKHKKHNDPEQHPIYFKTKYLLNTSMIYQILRRDLDLDCLETETETKKYIKEHHTHKRWGKGRRKIKRKT